MFVSYMLALMVILSPYMQNSYTCPKMSNWVEIYIECVCVLCTMVEVALFDVLKNSYFRFSFSGGQQEESGVQSEAAGEGESSAATQEPGEPPQGRE